MKNKTLAITTMVSMLALTACGGGGGGGSVNISAPTPINIGTVSFDTLATDNFAQLSVLRDVTACLLYTSPSPRDCDRSRMPSSA